jgi:outer membrane biosynthesis protein TonB
MQVLFLAILVLGAYFAYTKISKKPKNQEAEPVKADPVVEVKAEEPVVSVEAAPAVIEKVKPAAKKPATKKAPAKKPAAKKPAPKKAPAKAETTKAKKAKK